MATRCGPTRNLTPLFFKLKATKKQKKNRFSSSLLGHSSIATLIRDNGTTLSDSTLQTGREGLLSNHSPQHEMAQIEMTETLPPLWMDVIEEANDDLSKAKEKLSALQKVQQKRLLRIFGDEDSLQGPEREVELLSVQVTEILKRCELRIRKLNPASKVSPRSDCEAQLKKHAQRNIAIQLQSLSQQMRLQQQHYVSELRKRYQIDSNVSQPHTITQQQQQETIDPNDRMISDSQLMGELKELEQKSDMRHQEITKIAQSMAELHQLFQDLNVIVIDQGTILDRIDYNIEQIVTESRDAVKQIRKAEQNQRSGRAGKVILFLVGMISLLIFALTLKWTI